MGGPLVSERRGVGPATRDGARGRRVRGFARWPTYRCGPSELDREGERGKGEGQAKQVGGPHAEKGGRVWKNSFHFFLNTFSNPNSNQIQILLQISIKSKHHKNKYASA